jgi:hypothetical protein
MDIEEIESIKGKTVEWAAIVTDQVTGDENL